MLDLKARAGDRCDRDRGAWGTGWRNYLRALITVGAGMRMKKRAKLRGENMQMSDIPENSIEDQKLAFEKEKWKDDFSLRKLESEAKQRESGWVGRAFSPLTTTLMAGILTVIGSVVATTLQSQNALDLETRKFESSKQLELQKQEHELILKMASVGDVEQSRKNLLYLVDTGLIRDPVLAAKIHANQGAPVLPVPSGSVQTIPLPGDLARKISPAAVNMIVGFEVNGRENYEKLYSHPQAFGGNSGVSIGIGYDLAYVTGESFRQDWGQVLSSADLNRLTALIGLTGASAKDKVASVQDIMIKWEDAVSVFGSKQLSRYAALVDASLPSAKELPLDSYGALVSLVYNRGASFTLTGDRFNEMRAIKDLMDKREFGSIAEQIRSMKRLAGASAGLQKRRDLEAAMFERGFAPSEQREDPSVAKN
jgi:hypothetical protein